jgi:hypothetical protein
MQISLINTEPLEKQIRAILTKYGVLGNGYGGYISGKLNGNLLSFYAPKFEDRTYKEVRTIIDEVTKNLVKLKKDTVPDDFEVEIINEKGEWGTNTQYLLLTQSRKEFIS